MAKRRTKKKKEEKYSPRCKGMYVSLQLYFTNIQKKKRKKREMKKRGRILKNIFFKVKKEKIVILDGQPLHPTK